MSTFEEAVTFLNEKDVQFIQAYEYVGKVGPDRVRRDLPIIEQILPPFSSDEWLDLISSDSELLGACCGTISAARDVIYGRLRQGRWMYGEQVWEFFATLAHHDGFEYMLRKDDERYKEWDAEHYFGDEKNDAIYRFWKTFDVVKDHVRMKPPHTTPYPEDSSIREPLRMSLSTLDGALNSLYWATSCFSKEDPESPSPQWMLDQKRAARQLTIARLMPALRDVLDHIDTLDLGDFEGFAVVKKEEPDEVCRNGAGACLYTTEAQAKDMIEGWAKARDEKDPDEIPDHYVCPRETTLIRPVSVSSKTGLTFLDKETA
jgi:hypothetical protein